MKVELHIDALVLRGIPCERQHAIRAALEAKLAELLCAGNAARVLNQPRNIVRLDAGTIRLALGASGGALGARIGEVVHRRVVG